MAQKRMFDKSIIETDDFLDMGMPTKALYFLLGMEADDEGFVSPKRVMRLYGGNDDDLRILIAKGFVILFKSGVVVITDWKENNYLDKNRIKETRYKTEKRLLSMEGNKYRMLNECLTSIEEKSIEENRREEMLAIASVPLENLKTTIIGEKNLKNFRNARRAEIGKKPMTPRKQSEKQKLFISAAKTGIEYFKQQGYEQHGMQFLEYTNDKRNAIILKLVISAYEKIGDLTGLIDWWFQKKGEWAEYAPEQCFSIKTIERFKNKGKTQQKGGLKL